MSCPIHRLLSAPTHGSPALLWLPEEGVGFFDVDAHNAAENSGESPYDASYFERYAERMNDPIGVQLMKHRSHLVHAYGGTAFPILDVGIGSGAFVEAMGTMSKIVFGFDVNPAGIDWLKARHQWGDLYAGGPGSWEVATFWDSLEHIRDPRRALDQVGHMAFVAIPIFRDVDHLLASRHYRKDEHFWYFTRAGFRAFAEGEGFEVLDILATETAIGRDDIETFVLRRHAG